VSEVGATRVAANGYHYTKEAERGWVLTHWLTAEKKLGRLIDPKQDVVQFVDPKFKKDPYNPDGVRVIKKRSTNRRRRLAVIEDRIRELEAERAQILRELGK